MNDRITIRQRRRLEAGISARIRKLKSLRGKLRYLDNDVFTTGMALFASESSLALWLCEPAVGLGGKIPLRVMHTAKGRKQVVELIRAIGHGIF